MVAKQQTNIGLFETKQMEFDNMKQFERLLSEKTYTS